VSFYQPVGDAQRKRVFPFDVLKGKQINHFFGGAGMLKGKYVLLSLAAGSCVGSVASVNTVNSGIVDACKSTVSAAAGVVLVCPLGDGDPLTTPVDGGNSMVSLTVRDNTNTGIPGIPATDMWLVGCNDGLLLCGGSSGSNADLATNASGQTTFSNEPVAGGCDTGLFAVVQGVIIQTAGACTPTCLPIEARSPDYKGGPACPGDLRCPDSKVTGPDFAWFGTHFTTAGAPKPYHACADYAGPLGSVTGPDFAKFALHFAGAGHKCPI
jgi:hypothetical protein